MTTPKAPRGCTTWLPIESVKQLDKIMTYQKKQSPYGNMNRSSVNQQLIALAYAQLPKEAQ